VVEHCLVGLRLGKLHLQKNVLEYSTLQFTLLEERVLAQDRTEVLDQAIQIAARFHWS
jgi:hypothetical protein